MRGCNTHISCASGGELKLRQGYFTVFVRGWHSRRLLSDAVHCEPTLERGGDGTVQRLGGSSRLRQFWAWRGGWIERPTEPSAEHAVAYYILYRTNLGVRRMFDFWKNANRLD